MVVGNLAPICVLNLGAIILGEEFSNEFDRKTFIKFVSLRWVAGRHELLVSCLINP